MTKAELKENIIESMEGIIIDNEALTDKGIVDFYADVFVSIVDEYVEQFTKEIELQHAWHVAYRKQLLQERKKHNK